MFGVLRRTALAGAVTIFIAAVGWMDSGLAQVSAHQVSAPDSDPYVAALTSADRSDAVMPTAGWARPPIGHLDFCRIFPDECKRHGETAAVALTENLWTELVAVNRVVNKQIAPVTDLEFYKTEEYWTLPTEYGDCEDYVLLKRQALIRQGWPSGALLVTVVFDEIGDGHAVLIARTDRGDFVLDNKVNAIRIWSQTPYRYVKRQSISDPDRWVAINDSRWPVDATTSSN
jgi:predicted transglutaminase-like cysteine proteinase